MNANVDMVVNPPQVSDREYYSFLRGEYGCIGFKYQRLLMGSLYLIQP